MLLSSPGQKVVNRKISKRTAAVPGLSLTARLSPPAPRSRKHSHARLAKTLKVSAACARRCWRPFLYAESCLQPDCIGHHWPSSTQLGSVSSGCTQHQLIRSSTFPQPISSARTVSSSILISEGPTRRKTRKIRKKESLDPARTAELGGAELSHVACRCFLQILAECTVQDLDSPVEKRPMKDSTTKAMSNQFHALGQCTYVHKGHRNACHTIPILMNTERGSLLLRFHSTTSPPPLHLSTSPRLHVSTSPPLHLSTSPPPHLSTSPPLHLSTSLLSNSSNQVEL